MIKKGNDEIRRVNGIDEQSMNDIEYFLQGAIYCWCKNRKNEWFSLRNLMGGDNYYWQGTPLIALYEKHEDLGKDDPVGDAGKDGGWILKKVIKDDDRKFETKTEEMIRKYRWLDV